MNIINICERGRKIQQLYQNILDFTKTFSSVLDKAFDDLGKAFIMFLAVVVHFFEKPFVYLPVLPWSWVSIGVCVVCVVGGRHIAARVRR